MMLRDAWFIGSRDVWLFFRTRETLIWTFLMPIAFIVLFGAGISEIAEGPPPTQLELHVGRDVGFLADEVELRLAEQGFEVTRVETEPGPEAGTHHLVIPDHFTQSVLADEPVRLEFRRPHEGLMTNFDDFRIRRSVYTVLADLLAARRSGENPGGAHSGANDVNAEVFQRLREMPRKLTLEVSPAGRRAAMPPIYNRVVPGITVQFVLLALLSVGGITLLIDRRSGILARLASAPISSGSIVLGKWAGRTALAMAQIVFLMLFGTLVFGVSWGSSLPMVLLVLFAFAGAVAAAAILLGTLATTEVQIISAAAGISSVLAALGGCFWPIEVVPDWMQRLSLYLPSGWVMDALHRLMNFGDPAAAALPHLVGLALLALFLGWLATRHFRFQ